MFFTRTILSNLMIIMINSIKVQLKPVYVGLYLDMFLIVLKNHQRNNEFTGHKAMLLYY